MKKELTHRSHELKALGWNQEDLTRYEDLWDYSQRWGLINLEREDRQFLKKAEKLLPKIQNKKISVKKTIEEKSYYLWQYRNWSCKMGYTWGSKHYKCSPTFIR